MGVAPEAMNKFLDLVIGSRHFYIVILEIFYFSKVAPEHLGKNLCLIKGSRSIQMICPVAILYFSCRQTFPCQNLFTSMNSRNFSALWVHCFHHVDTSCKWGTHVLRFSWRTFCNLVNVEILICPCCHVVIISFILSSSNGSVGSPHLYIRSPSSSSSTSARAVLCSPLQNLPLRSTATKALLFTAARHCRC